MRNRFKPGGHFGGPLYRFFNILHFLLLNIKSKSVRRLRIVRSPLQKLRWAALYKLAVALSKLAAALNWQIFCLNKKRERNSTEGLFGINNVFFGLQSDCQFRRLRRLRTFATDLPTWNFEDVLTSSFSQCVFRSLLSGFRQRMATFEVLHRSAFYATDPFLIQTPSWSSNTALQDAET